MNRLLPRVASLTASLLFSAFTLHAEPADELIQNGDTLEAKYRAAEALKYYLPAEKLEPKNADLLVRIARQYRHLMSDAKSKEEKLKCGCTAVEYAKRAVAADPNDADAFLALAISYGKLQPLQSNRDRIQGSRIVKDAADKVIKLNPASDLAWHILGRWHMGLAEISPVKRALAQMTYGKLPPSTFEEAAKCFQKAIELNPNRLMHYIDLGRVYADMGRPAEAKRLIAKGLAMRETEKDDPETKREGRELLAKLG